MEAGNYYNTRIINSGRNGPTYGIYGSKGVASILNFPGSREPSCSWKDSTGIFWMYGGLGNGRNETGIQEIRLLFTTRHVK